MKEGTRNGLGLKYKREEKEPVLPEEEEKILETRITGEKDGQVLAVHHLFRQRKAVWAARGEHRNLTIANFEVRLNYITGIISVLGCTYLCMQFHRVFYYRS